MPCANAGEGGGPASPDIVRQYRQPVAKWPPIVVDEGVLAQELGELPPLAPEPGHTPVSEALGKLLFFDPRLSASGQIACASCHDPELGWADGRRFPFGHDRTPGRRNAMTLLNVGYFDRWSWDGRAESLAQQVLRAIESPIEMNADLGEIVARLNGIDGYARAFVAAFGEGGATAEGIGKALAAFARTIRSRRSRFDLFAGGDYERLSDREIEGLHLFRTRARCMNCHHGPLFSDGKFHHTGLSYYGRRFEDLGRYEVTGKPADRGKFRTPSLRDLQFTGPWMHNGLFVDFRGILNMYNNGMTRRREPRTGEPTLSPLIQPLNLVPAEIDALEAFLATLNRRPHNLRPPQLSGLALSGQSASLKVNANY
ncbi:MAG: cytochrome-c peroxidase [Gammaproteobacteria bacterium]|nr:cytochrome-c peroxidase [Gammaproteobacteria bacterium]